MNNKNSQNMPEISIGMPVFNGEAFLEKRLKSILEQSFENFELIISDNASTDKTEEICKTFQKSDKRIRYIRQSKNKGVTWNLNFVLKESKGEFFMWAAVDDMISPQFVEKNYEILQNNEKIVASISKIEPLFSIDEKGNRDNYSKLIQNLRDSTRPRSVFSISGTFDEKVRKYLRSSSCQVIYSLFRRKELSTCFHESFIGNDWAVFLNVLKYGDLHVLDDVLMYEYQSGITGKGIIKGLKHYENNWFTKIFPWYPLTKWCMKNLERRIFLKNLDYFVQLNLEGIGSYIIDKVRNKYE